ncbi:hypothetical protein [Liquorilactobacillus mali]|uniref:hypothetical protein n=1 Tax=Liquorilactobacillus mali TaxID=1618 RepID=UPI002952E94F|nr:hypothetical protein [Liquorilactobacillus mali]MDV7758722.1 hypothetical protein [Liquorilactobacillus mali]
MVTDYKSLVISAIDSVKSEKDPAKSFLRLLTLDGMLQIEDAEKTLGYKEKAVFKILNEHKIGKRDIILFMFQHNNKLEIRDSEDLVDKNDLFAFKFKFNKKQWSVIVQDSKQQINDDWNRALHLLKEKADLSDVIDNIQFYLSHMAPIIYYVDESVYSNFDYLSNLFTKRRKEQEKFLFPCLLIC